MATATLEKTAKLADVAKAAGVSQGTVSNVFNRPQLVREEVRERVRQVAKSLGYRGPDPKGRLLRAGKVNAIGVATAEPLKYFFEDPFARVLMTGITEVCDANGAGISLVSAVSEEELAWNVKNALVDGFILFCFEDAERLITLTRERQLPFIALALGHPDQTIAAIGIDNVAGARLAASHLAELGHRRYAVLTMPLDEAEWTGRATREQVEAATFSGTRDRLQGYFGALEQHGIDANAIPIHVTRNEEESVNAGMEEIFRAGFPPTAILAQSDKIALSAMRWLTAHGLSVPGDVSIVGFDGVPEGAASTPALTTVSQPIAEIGRRAARAIIEGLPEPRRQTMPLELIVRSSTAAPRG